MRQSIINDFDKIYILDLGGESDSANSSNVFDITKGVAIALLVRDGTGERAQKYAVLEGSRLGKYEATASLSVKDTVWRDLSPNTPNYFLVPMSDIGRAEYESWYSISAMFPVGSTGVLTARDRLAVAFDQQELVEGLIEFASAASGQALKTRFGLQLDDTLAEAQVALTAKGPDQTSVRDLDYRPFDRRVFYDDDRIVFRRRKKVMQHLIGGNVALSVCRLTKGGDWRHAFVACAPGDDSYVSDRSKERAYVYPLRLADGAKLDVENLSPDFRDFVDNRYGHHYSPEEILGFIYAVLHAPTYRKRYAEFLKIGFPRIPFPETKAEFDTLSRLGWALVQAHLLNKVPTPLGERLGVYHGKGDHMVEAVRYSPEEQAVWINKERRFAPVPQSVWDFHIGGYQVLDKYLKSRKGRALSLDETTHVGLVAEALAFTISQMERIDADYRAAFPDGDKSAAPLA